MSQIGLPILADTSMPTGRERERSSAPLEPIMVQTRAKIKGALDAKKIPFLNSCNESNVIDMIKEGVMIVRELKLLREKVANTQSGKCHIDGKTRDAGSP